MKKLIVATIAAAALMAGAAPSFAQEQEGNWYVIDSGGTKLIVGKANPKGTPLLLNESGNAPANCAAGSFWQSSDGAIVACDDATAMFDTRKVNADELATMQEEITNTEPYTEDAMLLIPRESGGSKQ